jgi:hypothetical protein
MAAELPSPGVSVETSSRRYRRKHRNSGLCIECNNPTILGRARCGTCTSRNKKKAGVCRDCGVVSINKSRCDACREKLRRNYLHRAKHGQCVKCKDKATAGAFCFKHWLGNIGSAYKMNWKNGGLALLHQLWIEQQGLCAVTGVSLVPGSNASLDHIVPVSRGGDNSKTNLRWVLDVVNKAKWDMTDEQFVELCRLVVAAAESKKVQTVTILRSIAGGK